MEFELAGNTYDIGKLNVIQQLNVGRRITAAFSKQIPKLQELLEASKGAGDDKESLLVRIAEPFAEAVGGMSDDDVEYLVKTCLGVVRRKTAGGWQRITAPNTADFLYQDIRGAAVINLIWKVVEDNLGDFFAATPQPSPGQ